MNLNTFKMGYILAYKSTGSLINRLIVKRQLGAGFKPEDSRCRCAGFCLTSLFSSFNRSIEKNRGQISVVHARSNYRAWLKAYSVASLAKTLCFITLSWFFSG